MITTEQYGRWRDFSLRMAQTCFKRKRNPDAAEIERNVMHFFDCLNPDDLLSIVDWDNSDPYPEGSKYHGVDGFGRPYIAMLVTDMCKEHEDGWNPHYEEDRTEKQRERFYAQFVGPVVCCIRAGMDMAVSPSAGVMGFTAGDLRAMYPDGLPEWVTGGKDHRWSYWLSGELNGTFAEMPDDAAVLL